MSTRNLFLLAGAALLIVGCNSGLTSPTSVRSGGAAGSMKAPDVPPSTDGTTGTKTNECRSGYYVWARGEGEVVAADSVCMDDIQ